MSLEARERDGGEDGKRPGQRMNFVDRAVSFISPQRGVQRMAARQLLHQFGANEMRGKSGGQAKNASSESYFKNRDRINDMWDARDLATYDWIGGTLARIVLYAIGDLRCHANTGDDQLNELYNADFDPWANTKDDNQLHPCDVTGRQPLIKLAQFGLMGMLVDGDHGYIEVLDDEAAALAHKNGEEPPDLMLQNIQADRIGSPIEAQVGENYIGGIQVMPENSERPGAVDFYKVTDRTRFGQYVNPRAIQPSSFIHLWDPKVSDQYRGVTYLRPILPHARDIREWVAAEKQAGKVQSMFAAALTSKDPYKSTGADAWTGRTSAGTPTQEAEWGKILKFAEGEAINFLNGPQRPSGAFMAFIQTLVRIIAVALDLPFGFVWDLAMLGGVTARIEVENAQRRIQYFQKLMVDTLLNRARNAKIARSIALGKLPPCRYWDRCDWHFGPWIVTDAGYQMSNDVIAVKMGWKAASDVTAQFNRDNIEVARKNATTILAYQKIAAETRVPIEAFAGDWLPMITAQLAAAATPPSPPPPAGSLEAVGDKGAKQIIEMLSQVTTGEMDRDAAVQILINTYGLDDDKAEEIVPPQGKQKKMTPKPKK